MSFDISGHPVLSAVLYFRSGIIHRSTILSARQYYEGGGNRQPETVMWRLNLLALVLTALVLAAGITGSEPANESGSASLYWSTAKEEGDLVGEDDPNSEGGFSSLDGMLQWAIGTYLTTHLAVVAFVFRFFCPFHSLFLQYPRHASSSVENK